MVKKSNSLAPALSFHATNNLFAFIAIMRMQQKVYLSDIVEKNSYDSRETSQVKKAQSSPSKNQAPTGVEAHSWQNMTNTYVNHVFRRKTSVTLNFSGSTNRLSQVLKQAYLKTEAGSE